ncbi:gluconokinase [Amphibiibacter pelophylacis]|uniref:Gluconokinase n=1 Tax=Amphibiibacter pelophylacis TaxID=1799477 RepID=A0ACC6NYU8_9BURK
MNIRPASPLRPAPLIIMGVSGCGKSTLGQMLAQHLDGRFIEGDSYHPAANIARMSQGIALTDEDRWGWLDTLAQELRHAATTESGPAVLACSALKASYRDRLRQGDPRAFFVLLQAPREVLAQRLDTRESHFMGSTLLDSQLGTIEPLRPDERGVVLDATVPPQRLLEQVLALQCVT